MVTIIGLSIGLATFLILLHYTTYELSFDQFHQNKDEIYRVACSPNDGANEPTARNFRGTGILIRDQFPEVKQVVRFWRPWNRNDGESLKAKGQIHYEQKIIQSDPSFFQVFPTLLKRGDPNIVLSEPNTIVLSESRAKAYFGDEDPIGQIISDSEYDLKVTGIMYDVPENSHLDIDMVRTYYDDFFLKENWEGFYLYTYLTIDPTANNIKAVERKLEKTVRAKQNEFEHLGEVSFELQPITEIHLSPNLSRELTPNSDRTLVYFLMGIGITILVMAWINHVNLSISSFFGRTKELSIRGVVGADRSNLRRQLLVEYLLLNALAVPIAFLLVFLSNQFLVEQRLTPDIIHGVYIPRIWIATTLLLILGSILTGLFPSILIRKIQFISDLKTRSTHSVTGIRFRSAMVIIQLFASIILISGVAIVRLQLRHIKAEDKNMKVDQVIAVRNPTAYSEFEPESDQASNYNLFKEQLTATPVIEQVASSSAIPGSPVGFSAKDGLKRNREDPYDPTQMKVIYVDDDFLNVYDIPLLAGRSFSDQSAQDLDEKSIMLSDNAIKHLGFSSPESAIGQQVDYFLYARWNTYEIIGVYKDYAHESAKSERFPSLLYYNRYGAHMMHHLYFSLKIIKDTDPGEALAHLKKTWSAIWPEKPLEYYFVDQVYEQQFRSEKVLGQCFTFFAFVAIVLACLGVLGITYYEIQQKMREISIRKVLGSSISHIVRLMSGKYIQLMLISACLAVPIAFWLADKWLSNYPTRISLDFWIFLVPIGVVIALVFFVSGSMIYKTANSNPARVLRSE